CATPTNSPSDNVFHSDRPAEANLRSKKKGQCPTFDSPPTYHTPLMLFHKVELELSSKGASFLVDSAKSIPLVVASLD
ncbi:unnamed protein product, partial [Sphenostylis stenocarpa]